jgi:hypothetical protein
MKWLESFPPGATTDLEGDGRIKGRPLCQRETGYQNQIIQLFCWIRNSISSDEGESQFPLPHSKRFQPIPRGYIRRPFSPPTLDPPHSNSLSLNPRKPIQTRSTGTQGSQRATNHPPIQKSSHPPLQSRPVAVSRTESHPVAPDCSGWGIPSFLSSPKKHTHPPRRHGGKIPLSPLPNPRNIASVCRSQPKK